MSYWGNDIYGDCTTAEEAFAKAVAKPRLFIDDETVVNWAAQHGYLNGADLHTVLTTMQTNGFPDPPRIDDDGQCKAVDWTRPKLLKGAIYSHGPVKIGVDATLFQSNEFGQVTPGFNGWAMYNYLPTNELDHCVSLCGYGSLEDLIGHFGQRGIAVSVPPGMPTGFCLAMFTWNSIGIIDFQSMVNITQEAWVRKPVTVII